MQKNYVQEILSIIHSGLPKAELAEKLSDYHEKDLADALEALTPAERQSLYSILGVETSIPRNSNAISHGRRFFTLSKTLSFRSSSPVKPPSFA